MAVCVAAASIAGAEVPGTRVIHGFSLMSWATHSIPDRHSPSYPIFADQPDYSANSLMDYTARFITDSATGTIVAEGLLDHSGEYFGTILQAWCGASMIDGWVLNFGKKIVKWEDGGFSNPSDIVNVRAEYAKKGGREGRHLVELVGTLPVGDSFVLDLSAVTTLDPATSKVAEVPIFLACGTTLYPFEIRLKGGFYNGSTPDVGLALKASLYNLQWYIDALYSREPDLSSISRGEADTLRVCLGFTGTLPLKRPYAKGLEFAFELSGRSDGLTRDEGMAYVRGGGRVAADSPFKPYVEYRWYAFGKASLRNIANVNLDWTEIWHINAVDRSGMVESKLSWAPRNVFTITGSYTLRYGDSSSESATLGSRHQFEIAVMKAL